MLKKKRKLSERVLLVKRKKTRGANPRLNNLAQIIFDFHIDLLSEFLLEPMSIEAI